MSDGFLIIDAGHVLTPTERFTPGRVIVRNHEIEAAGVLSDVPLIEHADWMEAPNLTVTPGFIEPHIHGCGGVDVMDATYESLNAISRIVARHGTTSFLPTTVSSPPEVLGSVVAQLGSVLHQEFEGAAPLGIHLEGPFISAQKRGTHRPEHVRPPDRALFAEWNQQSQGMLKLITLAPELDGADAVAKLAQAAGVAVAMGHSASSYAQATAAVEDGVRYAVHTFNAMRELGHRDSGILGAVLSDDRVFAEIIADGIHVHPEVIRIFARAKGRDRIILATDAISATDMPDGRYVLGRDSVQVVDGVCRNDEGRLAGSTLTQEIALRNFVEWSGMRMDDALLGLTLNPARALRLQGRGRIEPGARADLVLIDENFRVMKTFVEGKLVFER